MCETLLPTTLKWTQFVSEKLFILDTVSLSHMTLGIRQNAYIQVSRVRFSYCQYFLVLTESFLAKAHETVKSFGPGN